MPQESEYEPLIYGTVAPEQRARVLDFLQTFPARNRIEQVAIIPADEWAKTQEMFKVRGGGHHAFTLPDARRTYLSSAAFEDGPESGVEWALAHESAHLSDPRAPALQQQFDTDIDRTARESLGRWLDDPHVAAYRKLKAAARRAFQSAQPEPAPIAPNLQELLRTPGGPDAGQRELKADRIGRIQQGGR